MSYVFYVRGARALKFDEKFQKVVPKSCWGCVGGHFQTETLCCRFWTIEQGFEIGKKLQYDISKMRGRGQWPFGTFPKIHPFWYHHPSLSKQCTYMSVSVGRDKWSKMRLNFFWSFTVIKRFDFLNCFEEILSISTRNRRFFAIFEVGIEPSCNFFSHFPHPAETDPYTGSPFFKSGLFKWAFAGFFFVFFYR